MKTSEQEVQSHNDGTYQVEIEVQRRKRKSSKNKKGRKKDKKIKRQGEGRKDLKKQKRRVNKRLHHVPLTPRSTLAVVKINGVQHGTYKRMEKINEAGIFEYFGKEVKKEGVTGN